MEPPKDYPGIARHSIWILISFTLYEFIAQLVANAYTQLYLFYYETELQLIAIYIIVAQVIFTIWNAVNDPIAGYFCNRRTRWTKKWGKQFPWVLIGGLPMFLFYFLLYAPPQGMSQRGLFFWLILVLCLADTFYSIYTINASSIFPAKFKSVEDRRRSGVVHTIVGSIGMVVCATVPPLIYKYYDVQSYKTMGLVMGIFGFVLVLLNIPGNKPDEHQIQNDLEKKEEKQEPFFKILKESMKKKTFVIYIIVMFLYAIFTTFAMSSLSYLLKYVTHAESRSQTQIWGAMILGILLSLPVWNKLFKKIDVRNTMIAGMTIMSISMTPVLFGAKVLLLTIVFFCVGIGMGGIWISYMPFFADVMDYMYVETGKRHSGMYVGIRTFFLRFVIILQTLVYLFIHNLTGFLKDQANQTPQVIFGILIHGVIIPMLAIALAAFILWKYYDIVGKKKEEMILTIAEMEK